MRTRGSESFIVLPLLPIFLLGAFPMLLMSLMGPAGLVILGILIACAGLTDILDANGTFNEQIIVHGYARGSERTRPPSVGRAARQASRQARGRARSGSRGCCRAGLDSGTASPCTCEGGRGRLSLRPRPGRPTPRPEPSGTRRGSTP